MKRIALVAGLLGLCMFMLAGVATAGKVGLAKTWVYDEDKTDENTASATWTKEGLKLVKNASNEIPVAAGVAFKGIEGQKLTQLSFDVKDDCGAGAPRFNIDTAAGTQFFGCYYGAKTPLANGWTHVEFTSDVTGGVAWGQEIKSVDLMRDEQGTSVLRNISVNNISVDKFPQS